MFSKSQKPQISLSQKAEERLAKPKVPSIISVNLRISGNLKSDGHVQVDGVVDGDIESNRLTIGASASVNGCVAGEVIKVAGTVIGGITGYVVELERTARVTGDINHHSLSIEAGAFIQGLCRRIDPKKIKTPGSLETSNSIPVVAEGDATNDLGQKSDVRKEI